MPLTVLYKLAYMLVVDNLSRLFLLLAFSFSPLSFPTDPTGATGPTVASVVAGTGAPSDGVDAIVASTRMGLSSKSLLSIV